MSSIDEEECSSVHLEVRIGQSGQSRLVEWRTSQGRVLNTNPNKLGNSNRFIAWNKLEEVVQRCDRLKCIMTIPEIFILF